MPVLSPSRGHSRSVEPSTTTEQWVAVAHLLDETPARTVHFAQDDVSKLASLQRPESDKGQLLFLRGYLSPDWVAEVGSRYMVDPEFFCRHLDFFGPSTHRNCFSLPSLASTGNNIMHFYVSTILRDNAVNPTPSDDLSAFRLGIHEQVVQYRRHLQRLARPGDSIVRHYQALDLQYSVIEQRISVCVTPLGEAWRAVIWMDGGRSLSASPSGPWLKHTGTGPDSSRTALPVIQHHNKMTLRKTSMAEASTDTNTGLPGIASQDATGQTMLPLEYPSLLAAVDLAKRGKTQPLEALIPVFAHAAFSEVAFLNLVDDLVKKLMEPTAIDNFRSGCFETLQDFDIALRRHADQLRSSLRSLRILSQGQPWRARQARHRSSDASQHDGRDYFSPPVDTPQLMSSSLSSSFTAAGILEDYEDLVDRCVQLQKRVSDAMATEMNRAMILESRNAIEQSERTKKLTLLATYFIPLSFTASLFGMNFEMFGQGQLPLWWYLVFAIPLTLLTHVLYSWNEQNSLEGRARSWLRQRWARHRKKGQASVGG